MHAIREKIKQWENLPVENADAMNLKGKVTNFMEKEIQIIEENYSKQIQPPLIGMIAWWFVIIVECQRGLNNDNASNLFKM